MQKIQKHAGTEGGNGPERQEQLNIPDMSGSSRLWPGVTCELGVTAIPDSPNCRGQAQSRRASWPCPPAGSCPSREDGPSITSALLGSSGASDEISGLSLSVCILLLLLLFSCFSLLPDWSVPVWGMCGRIRRHLDGLLALSIWSAMISKGRRFPAFSSVSSRFRSVVQTRPRSLSLPGTGPSSRDANKRQYRLLGKTEHGQPRVRLPLKKSDAACQPSGDAKFPPWRGYPFSTIV